MAPWKLSILAASLMGALSLPAKANEEMVRFQKFCSQFGSCTNIEKIIEDHSWTAARYVFSGPIRRDGIRGKAFNLEAGHIISNYSGFQREKKLDELKKTFDVEFDEMIAPFEEEVLSKVFFINFLPEFVEYDFDDNLGIFAVKTKIPRYATSAFSPSCIIDLDGVSMSFKQCNTRMHAGKYGRYLEIPMDEEMAETISNFRDVKRGEPGMNQKGALAVLDYSGEAREIRGLTYPVVDLLALYVVDAVDQSDSLFIPLE